MEKYGVALDFLNRAKGSGVSYDVASKVLPDVVAGKNRRKDHALYETLQAREFGKMLKKGEFMEAYEFMEEKGFFGSRIGGEVFGKWNVPESYMTKDKKNKLILEGIKHGYENPAELLNDMLRHFGHAEVIMGEDTVVSDLFKYGIAESVDLKKHDCGKCILSYEDGSFYFAVSKDKPDMIPRDLSLENITKVMTNRFMSDEVGLHRNIPGNPSRLLGGASYFMLENDKVFVFDYSQDFGRISVPILNKCFEGSGVEVVDDFGENSKSLEEEVSKHLRNSGKSSSRPNPDDDILF